MSGITAPAQHTHTRAHTFDKFYPYTHLTDQTLMNGSILVSLVDITTILSY